MKKFSKNGALSCKTISDLSALVFLLLLAVSSVTTAQTNQGGETGGKTVALPHIEASPVIDGLLDEEVWLRAAIVEDFHQMEPFEYSEPSQRMEVRIFYSETALYVAARMYEDDPTLITANVARQGQGLPNDDIFNLVLDPNLDRRSGYSFEINPNGVRVGGIYENVSQIDRNWSGIWQGSSRIDEQGWTAEIRIPFQSISFDRDSTSWGINFRRAIRRNSESIGWISRNQVMNPGVAGTATGLADLKQGLGLDVVPYFVARQEKVFGVGGYEERTVKPQVDFYYKITPQLNAALTINTDFSATEVDSRQVNLTRFSLFFPERRDFFLRDSDIFDFGRIGTGALFGQEGNEARPTSALQNGLPFFSRRIGLSAIGAPVDINAGVKVSGRINRWNVGTLVVRQDEDPNTNVDDQTVFVGRAALNVLAESQVGVIVTSGDSQSNLNNQLIGTDFRYRNSRLPGGRIVESEIWYQQSENEGISGNDAAYGFGISAPNTQGWRGAYSYKRIEDNFDPALGFVSQRGIKDHALDFGYRHFLDRGSYIRSVYGGFDSYRNTNSAGDLISETLDVRTNANNNSGDKVELSLIKRREVLFQDFTIYRASDNSRIVTIPVADYDFTEASAGISFAGRRRLSGSLNFEWGDYYDGDRFKRGMSLNWQASNRYNFGMSYSENAINLPQGNFVVRQLSLNTLLNFTPNLSWSNLLQYDTVSEGIGINSRLRWIPEPGREAYLVLNWGLVDLDKDNTFTSINSSLSLKFNYTLRF